MERRLLIDDFSAAEHASLGGRWQFISDRVMGGVSRGQARHVRIDRRHALRMTGAVSLENNGGFVQVALDLGGTASGAAGSSPSHSASKGSALDASAFTGVAISARGDGREYGVHLRTSDLRRPWQSYRCRFLSTADWHTFLLPFSDFAAHRVDRPFDPRKLRRLGVIAIGEPGAVDLYIDEMFFYS